MNAGQIASIVEGGVGLTAVLGGALYGGIKSGKLNRKYEKGLKGLINDNKEWWNIKRSKDYTQRPDVQAAVNLQRQLLNDRYNRDAARNVVAGGTNEALALEQQAANESLSRTGSDIASAAANYYDNNERQYRSQDYALRQQQLQNYQQRAAATAQAASQVVNTGLKMTGDSFQHFAQASGGMGGGANLQTTA